MEPTSPLDLPAAPDAALDRYARLVRSALGVPTALVSLVSTTRQVFPGAVGLPPPWQASRQTPLTHSFCQYVVATREPLVVADARQDAVLHANLAIPDLGVIAYAGIPLHDADGTVVGSLCAIDDQPREWTPTELEVLTDLAAAASTDLQLRQAVAAAEEAVLATRRSREHVARILELMPVSYLAVDEQWRFTTVNAEAERVLGSPREQLLGGVIWDLFPATAGTEFEAGYRRTAETGQVTTFDAYYPAPLDAWYETRVTPEGSGVALYSLDVSARYAAQHASERAATRSALLASVATALAQDPDAHAVVSSLPRLLVPELGEWCLLTLFDPEARGPWRKRLREAGSWHADPTQRSLVAELAGIRASHLSDESLTAVVLRTGEPVVVAAGMAQRSQEALREGAARELLDQLAPAAAAVLPLPGRSGTLGLLSVVNGATRGAFSTDDIASLTEVAAAVGLALDNSRLYAQQRDLAVALQRSLLTRPVQPDHGQIVVRYIPAARSAQVGGDWYDAFLTRDGATVLVIGDVIGHDSAAAAEMGQVRGLVRAVAARTGEGPAGVLRATDELMQTLQVDTSATAVVARLEQSAGERKTSTTRLRWSSAGHPPPMVIHPGGRVEVLEDAGGGLLLGVFPGSDRAESVVELERGATVLLYTDGLVERRGQSLEVGLELLRGTLVDLAAQDGTLDEVVDAVLARLAPGAGEDDVALIAVRLHRQDRPRPAGAGPNRIPDDVPRQPA